MNASIRWIVWAFCLHVMGGLYSAALAQSGLPDLTLDRRRIEQTVSLEKRFFAASDCAVKEGCLRRAGWRTLLRFDVSVVNVGQGDLVLGHPEDRPDWYEFSPCHAHYHFRELISYDVFNWRGQLIVRGTKQAFCLRDNFPYLANAPPSRGYDCEYQGITAGWEDVYDKSLDCQWLDVTGIKPGLYKMRVAVNRNRRLRENNYWNNVIWVKILIPRGHRW